MVEDPEDGRNGDALYIIDAPQDGVADEIVSDLEDSEIDSSYAATYWPWVKVFDSNENIYINLPVTKDVVRNLAYTDNTSYPWFAPAGINRGDVECVRACLKTKLDDEDAVYAAGINPVKTFAVDGVKIWGNKTMYDVDSPLNRVNVRRLMIRVKKLISSSAKQLIFDQYDDTLKNQFMSIVDPILANVKSNRGIHDYMIIIDDSAEARDAHTLPCTIKIKPTPTLEYIDLTFTIYPESVSFEN
jgi:phage tail sheath protein FI